MVAERSWNSFFFFMMLLTTWLLSSFFSSLGWIVVSFCERSTKAWLTLAPVFALTKKSLMPFSWQKASTGACSNLFSLSSLFPSR